MNWEGDRVSNQRIMLCSTSRVGFQLVGIQPWKWCITENELIAGYVSHWAVTT